MYGDGLPAKLKKLIKKAGIGNIDMNGKFVAIKMHFGELGNLSFLRPNYARAVADVVKELGGKPFLTDCNTMYPGKKKERARTPLLRVGKRIYSADRRLPDTYRRRLKGTDDILVPVNGGEYVKEAKIGRAVMDADVFISLTHFKGHEMTGFGGAIKKYRVWGCGLPGRKGRTAQRRKTYDRSRALHGLSRVFQGMRE